MRYVYKLCLLTFLAVLFIVTAMDDYNTSSKQSTSMEPLHSSNQTESKEFYITLDGEWHFFEK